jgi:hypothetical protein
VLDGEGVATRKYDGTCCLVRGGKLYKRYEVKKGKTPPPDFELADYDDTTGKSQGWVSVGDGPEDQYHREAWESWRLTAEVEPGVMFPPLDGTYELIGPKVQGNPEGYSAHVLISHATETPFDPTTPEPPRDYDGLAKWMRSTATHENIEGIVWHWPQPDGTVKMAKLKRRDFE